MEKMTRRDFLKAAGTAAVGVAAYNLEGVRNVFAAGEGSVKVSANGGAGSRAKVYFSKNTVNIFYPPKKADTEADRK